jgi:cation transport ATPase
MKSTFTVTGMTCVACEYKIKHLFGTVDGVIEVIPSKDLNNVIIESSRPISISLLQNALSASDKYAVSEIPSVSKPISDLPKSWWHSYKPILLIFLYITVTTMSIQYYQSSFDTMQWMRHFMAGFFLVFSFFKLLNLRGFAESYSMYDILAAKWHHWAYIYAFVELGLAIAYILDCCPLATNLVTLIVMCISIIGVLRSVLNKQKIQCACLGAIFDLPMSTVTIIEDALMIVMSAFMLTML